MGQTNTPGLGSSWCPRQLQSCVWVPAVPLAVKFRRSCRPDPHRRILLAGTPLPKREAEEARGRLRAGRNASPASRGPIRSVTSRMELRCFFCLFWRTASVRSRSAWRAAPMRVSRTCPRCHQCAHRSTGMDYTFSVILPTVLSCHDSLADLCSHVISVSLAAGVRWEPLGARVCSGGEGLLCVSFPGVGIEIRGPGGSPPL